MITTLTENCKHILQRHVKFMLNDKKVLRRGKLILFNTHDYYLTFTLLTNKKQQKVYEIFYPYSCDHDEVNKRIDLSYQISDLCVDENVRELIREATDGDTHTFHDSVINIYYDTE
jgi:hypothetical protein